MTLWGKKINNNRYNNYYAGVKHYIARAIGIIIYISCSTVCVIISASLSV